MRNATHSRDGTRHRHVKSNKLSFRFKNKIIVSPETQNDQGLFPALQETFFFFFFLNDQVMYSSTTAETINPSLISNDTEFILLIKKKKRSLPALQRENRTRIVLYL